MTVVNRDFRALAQKIISGGPTRRTRLHDEKGNLIGVRNLFFNAPRAFITGMARLAFSYRPVMPWISYEAIGVIERHLSISKNVLEFGSGMSTLWLSKRAARVWSVENFRPWHEKVAKLIRGENAENITYLFKDDKSGYVSFAVNSGLKFDLIIIDGDWRDDCAKVALELIAPGGIIYLDNSDRYYNNPESKTAEDILRSAVATCGGSIMEFTDFAPTQLFVQQGLLVKLDKGTESTL